jgi:hypothetical protein
MFMVSTMLFTLADRTLLLMYSPLGFFCEVRFAQVLVFCVVFCRFALEFFSFGHRIVCPFKKTYGSKNETKNVEIATYTRTRNWKHKDMLLDKTSNTQIIESYIGNKETSNVTCDHTTLLTRPYASWIHELMHCPVNHDIILFR